MEQLSTPQVPLPQALPRPPVPSRTNRRFLLFVGIIAVIIIGFFVFRGDDKPADEIAEDESSEQTENENTNQNPAETMLPEPPPTVSTENVTVSGILRSSDRRASGNLMVVEDSGRKIYIATARDFSALLGKEVTLDARGTIDSFVFLGFGDTQGSVAGTDTAVSGETSTVTISGRLSESDNLARGNYQIASESGKIYLKSRHSYAALVGSEVELTAKGTLESFTGAKLSKK